MNYVLKMRAEHHRRLAGLLQAAVPSESVAFLLCRREPAASSIVYLVDQILEIEPHEYQLQRPDFASVSPAGMARMAGAARKAGRVLVMAHIHPMQTGEVEFSFADHHGNARSFQFFHRRAPAPEHLALVWDAQMQVCEGLAYTAQGQRHRLESIAVVDDQAWRQFCAWPGEVENARYSRQALLLGSQGQAQLGRLRVAVIGLGGVGALMGMQLVHHGVRDLVYIDDDVVDDTNLPRLPFSSPQDVGVRKKVDLAADYAELHAQGVKIQRLPYNVESPIALAHLIGCDAVVICTDNTTSRAHVNQMAQQYLLTILDLGVQFQVSAAGAVANEVGRINLVRPGSACLVCSGNVNPARLASESVPREERQREGSYLRGLDDPQPSMLCFNMEVAGRGMQLLLGFWTGLFEVPIDTYEQRSFLKPKGGALMRRIAKAKQHSCPICCNVGTGGEVAPWIGRRAA